MKKFIVTGAKGFIGKRLVSELQRLGAEVASIDMGDRVEDLSGEWDGFYNLAWVGKGGVLRADYNIQMNNVKIGIEYYRQAQRLRCKRFINTGTIGEKMSRLPECAGIKSQNLIYAISKNYLHDILRTIESSDCKMIWATLGNIYGGSDAGGNIIDYCLRAVFNGEKAIFGPAEQPYDFIFVDDLVRALVAVGTSDRVTSDAFYLGNGTPRPLKEYLVEVGRLAGREDLIVIGGRPDDGTRYKAEWFDIGKLKAETDFEPQMPFEEGILKNVDSVRREMQS